MPIKLITSDGNGFLRKFVSEMEELERKRYNLSLKIPLGTNIPEEIQATSQQIADVKLAIKGLLANEAFWRESEKFPVMISDIHTSPNGDWNGNKIGSGSTTVKIRGKLILFKNALFDVTGLYTKEEAKLLVVKDYEAERSEIDFLKSRFDESPEKSEIGREHIPERIRNEVWRRDGGKCAECGSVYKLEFDHMVPVAKGGSNTARNLRILCEPCNRRKSDSIG
jgi:hypothetical protein